VVLLLAIDQFIDMGRTTTNVVGNSIASAVIAKWENGLAPWTGHAYPLSEAIPTMHDDMVAAPAAPHSALSASQSSH
jgi:Na+/H+-dicarboxylate symporter